MNFVAFVLVLAAMILGIIVAVIARKEPSSTSFLLGVAMALVAAGVVVQDVFVKWSHTIHT